jgi:hypothetical protein
MFQYPQFLNAILMYISSIVENSNSSLWSKVLIAKHKEQLKVNQLYTSVPKRVDNSFSDISVSLSIFMEHFTSSELQSNSTANTYRIAWRIGEPIEPGNPWTPTIYFSTLPNGWMPKNDLDLFDQFIFCVKESWLRLCQQIKKYLSVTSRPILSYVGIG